MTLAEPVKLALIVVTWNSAEVIDGLIESVLSVNGLPETELVIVDNDSADDTVSRVRAAAPDATIVQMGRNAGYAAGANAGILSSPAADAYVLLNPDIRLQADTLQLLTAELAQPRVGVVVPRLLDQSGRLRKSIRRDPSIARAWGEAVLGGTRAGRYPALGEVEQRASVYAQPREVDWATGAMMLISRECAAAIGEWDESYFLYSEETDYALRARDAGFVVRYCPAAVAVHFEGESHQSPMLYALLTKNRVKLYRSRHSALSSAAFWAGIFAGQVVRSREATHRAAVRALLGKSGPMARPGH